MHAIFNVNSIERCMSGTLFCRVEYSSLHCSTSLSRKLNIKKNIIPVNVLYTLVLGEF